MIFNENAIKKITAKRDTSVAFVIRTFGQLVKSVLIVLIAVVLAIH